MKKRIAIGTTLFALLIAIFSEHAVAQFTDPNRVPQSDDTTRALSDQVKSAMEQNLELKKALAEKREREKTQATREAGKLVTSAKLTCEIADADIMGHGTVAAKGKTIATQIYEVACSNGAGYIIETQGQQEPRIVSCFSAAATASFTHDVKNTEAVFVCTLPLNKDIKAVASALLKPYVPSCVVGNVHWLGITALKQTEYTEVSCTDGSGYILQIPRINSAVSIAAINCRDAAKRGLRCRLTDGGAVAQPITMQAYLDSFKQNGVDCEPVQLRLIGREATKRRYVIEAQCFDRPKGIVAYLPLEGNTNKFEMIDCDTAMTRNIRCKFVANP